MPTTLAAATPAAVLTLDERLALANLAMDDRLDAARADILIRTAWVDTPTLPETTPTTRHAPIAGLLRRARHLIAAGWCRNTYTDGRGYCLQGALTAADTTGRHAAPASHLVLAAISAHTPHAEGVSRWNDQQTSVAPVLAALDHAIRLADQQET